MSISFSCPKCGHSFKVGEGQAGKRGKCKQCGTMVRVPAAVPAAAPADLYGLDEIAAEPTVSALPRLGQGGRSAAAVRGASQGRSLWPVALAGVGVVVLVATLAIVLGRWGSSRKAPEKPVEIQTVKRPEPAEAPTAPLPEPVAESASGLKRAGAFGLPQAQAQILCDRKDLRLSAWNNVEHLFVQAIVWVDDDEVSLGESTDPEPSRRDRSSLLLDVDANQEDTPKVDRVYWLNLSPYTYWGLTHSVSYGNGNLTGNEHSQGRGVIRQVESGDGQHVRVDSFLIPLSEIKKRPGEKIRLAYWARSAKPSLTLNSVGFEHEGPYPHSLVPRAMYHELTLSDHTAPLDITQLPDLKNKLPVLGTAAKPFRKDFAPTPKQAAEIAEHRARVDALLNDLRTAGQIPLADMLTREIESAQAAVARHRKYDPDSAGHVIVGRVIGEQIDNCSNINAQMNIHKEGYFVGAVGTSGKPVGFQMHGYLPVAITPTGVPDSLEYVGEIRLVLVPVAMRATVKCTILTDGATGSGQPNNTGLFVGIGPINTPDGGRRGQTNGFRPGLHTVSKWQGRDGSAEYTASELSPMMYGLQLHRPGYVPQYRSLTLKPGEALDLGTIRLEKAISVDVSYRLAPKPSFARASMTRQIVLGGENFNADPKVFGYDLEFNQVDGKLRFRSGYAGTQIVDLGPGKLNDFLELDTASLRSTRRFKDPGAVVPESGHVYLLEQGFFNHWVLFQIQLDQKAPGP